MMEFHPFGDQAILIKFEQKIDLEINQEVHHLANMIQKNKSFTFCIPAYCSLTVGYDSVMSFQNACNEIQQISESKIDVFSKSEKRNLLIPVCYHSDFALDIEEIQIHTNLSKKEIVDFHTQEPYQVFMMGFLPGFAYLGKLRNELNCQRREHPRKKVDKGSVAIAGFQTGIYPSDAPGGWQIIGKTPCPVFESNRSNPFLFQTGDQVKFQSISPNDYLQIEKAVANGEFSANDFYE